PPAQKPPRQYVLLDASPATWGIPRLAGAAVALSVASRSRERQAEAVVLGAGRMDRPFEGLDRVLGIHELLDHQRWESGLREDLRALAGRVRAETMDHPTGADLFICTEAGRLAEIREWAGSSGLPSATRLHLFTCDLSDGRATLWRLQDGGLVPLTSLSLAAEDLLPAASPGSAPPETSDLSAARVEMNWDWSSNVTCAAVDSRGLAATGHANGEVHLWDANRAEHLGQRCRFPHAVTSVAISGEYLCASISNLMQSAPFSARLFAFLHTGGRITPIRSLLEREHPESLRAGWEPGQFFWFESPETLVEYRADRVQTRRHNLSHQKPLRRPFFVDGRGRWVVWKTPEGETVAFNLKGFVTGASRWTRIADQEFRHRAVDPEGRLLVQMNGGGTASEVRWIETPAESERGVGTIPGSQHPKAVSVASDRLVAENSNSLWFWALREGKLKKELIAPSQEIVALRLGTAPAPGSRVNALHVEAKGGAGLVLHWGELDVQADPIVEPAGRIYRSQVDGSRGTFVTRQTAEGTSAPAGLPRLSAGPIRVVCRSDRLIEFHQGDEEEALLRFWFKIHSGQWALVSRDFKAGNALGDLVLPAGVSLVHAPARIAAILGGIHG
ncbi:MAG TPA: hypothetical protein VEN81_13740, partial [Planctomycetota bacterium]|nr:hypothetical protein [Planctomycetota bacterium]